MLTGWLIFSAIIEPCFRSGKPSNNALVVTKGNHPSGFAHIFSPSVFFVLKTTYETAL